VVQENEIVVLMIATGVLVLQTIPPIRRSFSVIPAFSLLGVSYLALYCAWIATVAEGFFLPRTMNIVEHLCYAVNALLLVVWSVRVLFFTREEQ